MTGTSASTRVPDSTFSVPTCWPWLSGAISGSVRTSWVLTWAASPRGTATLTGTWVPILAVAAAPFQTSAEVMTWRAS